MIHCIKKYFKLIWLVLKYGRWVHSEGDFNRSRSNSLIDLQDFVPAGRSIKQRGHSKNTLVRNLVSQVAFFKKSLKKTGGHLTAGTLSYIRIPKSASTSMSKAMLEKMYPTLKQNEINDEQINYLTDVNLHVIGTQSVNHTYFTIVRNPFSRLVSVHRSFIEKSSQDYIYRDYLFGILPQHLSFSDFVNRIANIPDRVKDQHIKPQNCFLEYYEKNKIEVKVFKLEDSKKLNQFLSQNSLQLAHLNKSEEPYDYRSYYNANTLSKVNELYKIDIERFGYQQEYKNVADYLRT